MMGMISNCGGYKWIKYKGKMFYNIEKFIKALKHDNLIKVRKVKVIYYEYNLFQNNDNGHKEIAMTQDIDEVIEHLEDKGIIEEDF